MSNETKVEWKEHCNICELEVRREEGGFRGRCGNGADVYVTDLRLKLDDAQRDTIKLGLQSLANFEVRAAKARKLLLVLAKDKQVPVAGV